MTLVERIWLFLKGVCMGSADVIPGVSGGTMALILGIYKRLVDAIRGLHLRWVPPLWRWLTDGRCDEDWRQFRASLSSMDLGFLVVLAAGVATAIVVGSAVIPGLLESHPVAMRAFFFGLIAASVWIPVRMMDPGGGGGRLAASVLVAAGTLAGGWWVTAPGSRLETTQTWETVVSGGESLETLARRGPSAAPAHEIYWADRNAGLRQAIRRHSPERAAALERLDAAGATTSTEAIEEMSRPYRDLRVPEGTEVQVPRPAAWFVFLAGAVAICAMILPGISGSYILLILGLYFFVLNAIKGTIEVTLSGGAPFEQAGYAALFSVGAGVGLLSFARLLSYLLERFPTPTLAGLVGLMIGCLRGIWPFRETTEAGPVNVLPETAGPEVATAAVAAAIGMVIVTGLTWVSEQSERTDSAPTPP